MTEPVEHLLRELAPQVLGALVRRYGQFDAAEDATQEALLAAAVQWPREGVPENPRSWLVSVAGRRLVDEFRSDSARRRRESTIAREVTTGEAAQEDDTLELLFLCAHPVALATVAARAHPAGGRRSHHGRDRGRVPGARDDHGPADQPGQTGDPA